ncbi:MULTISPECIES: sigma-70 family RNA polymerase sigma factor [Hahella]|uniref:DNA-directed RNA polymerase specialized sigma subunit sigma24-like protein n=1 Tax=Hahella chejuensis (strain KCTC 2396) TaxID=349521 RepID=Q2SCP5_HAHCH|nr:MULTISPECIES: sigma-70 family RNA polymerase sigma factor [Hahella]ABC31579.1 DNA-directed RNA polymerase specialized sigma subunit sigma24-like protein [Hahella chejuensis KCTC 2396]AZZ91225.1 sigma-70 family RNA polymerase sigma factor [Hahella sp. KA22]MBU6952334.1 sigma-70 family RNA polymerase sigma factor [Hahella sp. HN01]MDG9668594.1 sigma-70 family RNA polymerase sigma factor [Hahella sp. CR1]QAY54593.1 sigma-70 family RNA polymerase sigma factor [Hahella sp. KA22]
MAGSRNVTQLLADWQAGDSQALNHIIESLHGELRTIAGRYMAGERQGHMLQATALVNEAYLHLVDAEVAWNDRIHFLAVAAQTMRRILVDHARAQKRKKRGGDDIQVTLHEAQICDDGSQPDLLDLEDILQKLSNVDERKARIVEMSFFGGMTQEEIAEYLQVSLSTVERDLRFAKAWLVKELKI